MDNPEKTNEHFHKMHIQKTALEREGWSWWSWHLNKYKANILFIFLISLLIIFVYACYNSYDEKLTNSNKYKFKFLLFINLFLMIMLKKVRPHITFYEDNDRIIFTGIAALKRQEAEIERELKEKNQEKDEISQEKCNCSTEEIKNQLKIVCF